MPGFKKTSLFLRIFSGKAGLITVTCMWTVFIVLATIWGVWNEREVTLRLAHADALASYNKDLVYRRWAANNGGVYVPITDHTPPNPYLAGMRERDISTPSGRALTLINPAYMTRQVYGSSAEQYGVRGHITSLNPIRPQNAPDEWERQALMAFESGEPEVTEVVVLGGERYFRLMRPMVTEKGCLTCHAAQGYQVGDIRGGISVAVPLAPYDGATRTRALSVILTSCLILLVGLGCIWVVYRLRRRAAVEREQYQLTLQESEARFRQAIMAGGAVPYYRDYQTDPESYKFMGERILELTGYSANEITPIIFDQLEQECIMRGSLAHLTPGEAGQLSEAGEIQQWICDYRILTRNGKTRWVSDSAVQIRDGNNRRVGVIGVLQDITERKLAEERLEQSEARYRLIAENVRDVIWVMDVETQRFTYVSPSSLKLRGYTPEEIMTQSLNEALTTESAQRAGELLSFWIPKFTADPSIPVSVISEMDQPCKDGLIVCTEVTATLVVNEKGKLEVIGVSRDITERRRVEDALRKEEMFRSSIIQRAGEGICVCHSVPEFPYVQFTVWNEQMTQLTGYNMEEINRHGWYQSMYPDPDYQQKAIARMGEMRVGKDLLAEEWTITRAGGEKRTITISTSVLQGGDNIAHVLAVMTDITERKRAEEALRESEERLRAIVDEAPFGAHMYELKPDRRLVFIGANRSADQILHVANEQFVGKTIEEAFPSLMNTEIPGAYRRVAVSGEQFEMDQMDYNNDEIRGAFELHAFQTGSRRMAVFFRDVTERRRAEEEIQSLARFPSENPNPVLRLDRNGTLLYANDASETLLKKWNCKVGDDVPEFWRNMVTESLASKSGQVIEEEIAQQIYSFSVAPVARAGYVNLYGRDITERRRAEAQLQEQLDELSRWHQVTIGREDRIIALKREVNELLEKAGKPPRYPGADVE